MDVLRGPKRAEALAAGLFVLAVLYTFVRGTTYTVIAGVAFVLMVLGALPRQLALALLVGASVIVLLQTRAGSYFEGFTDASGNVVSGNAVSKDASGNVVSADVSGSVVEEKTPEEKDKEKPTEKFSSQKPMMPDHRERMEPLVLGKPYKLPSENDDKGYHLDAGTTFLNAYKALKPDQIAAMTRDTQELLATQKSLVGMLESFGPLMKDMNKISGFLNGK